MKQSEILEKELDQMFDNFLEFLKNNYELQRTNSL